MSIFFLLYCEQLKTATLKNTTDKHNFDWDLAECKIFNTNYKQRPISVYWYTILDQELLNKSQQLWPFQKFKANSG